ncbi:hypothetical protein QJS04_geneDACA010664 [Acorus gramineus]|uniref:Uncharacterized protein n=1 Tax=Acorus gramineus TaxID=55184 RepID=A0AAV9ALE1_ACOGR|nr:hypothetical protein QJS04_geneDACA010664 [Acorus gramineus]
MAIASVSSNSVQAQTAEYLKMKAIQQNRSCNSCIVGTRYPASSVFRDGIKKRSMKGLREWQGLPPEHK